VIDWIGSLLAAALLAVGGSGAPVAHADSPADSAAVSTSRTGDASRASATRVVLDGVSVRLRAGTGQVVTVNRRSGSHARVSLWQRTADGWQLLARAKAGRIGYGGLVRPRERVQGSGTTPLGSYRLLWSFGTHARAATWDLSHREIRAGDYWVEDNRSAYYNRYRNKSEGGFRWRLPVSNVNGSERLRDYPTQYEYSIVTSYNYASPVRHRGAGIFLHVNGPGATAGCVSAPRWFLQRTLDVLDPDLVPVIAIGR
jgi:L,D-peptidoglycan transpeptidase YkuD (ErfK/YbiS/YcfS/YnhG family)